MKIYLSRSASRTASADHPVGDPFGGPTYGEKTDIGSIVQIGASLIGGKMGSDATKSAAQSQSDATTAAIDEQRRQFDLMRGDQSQWLGTGQAANRRLSDLLGLGPLKAQPLPKKGQVALSPEAWKQQQLNERQAAQEQTLTSDPGYRFTFNQGMDAVNRTAAAKGLLGSGNRLTALNDYGQGMASNQFDKMYNRLAGLSGTGQVSAGSTGAAGMAGNIGNLLTNNANAQGAAGIAGANIYGNTLASLGNVANRYLSSGSKWDPYGTGTGSGYMGGGGYAWD